MQRVRQRERGELKGAALVVHRSRERSLGGRHWRHPRAQHTNVIVSIMCLGSKVTRCGRSRHEVGERGSNASVVVRSRSGMEITDLAFAPSKVTMIPPPTFSFFVGIAIPFLGFLHPLSHACDRFEAEMGNAASTAAILPFEGSASSAALGVSADAHASPALPIDTGVCARGGRKLLLSRGHHR